jgi:hypothetical protein
MASTSENLYHVKRTLIDYAKDISGATQSVDIRATFTDLAAAKSFARKALFEEGYEREWFDEYQEDVGDGVIVRAKTEAGVVFNVAIDTTANNSGLVGDEAGRVNKVLYSVLQTTIFYNDDHSGGKRKTDVEGTFLTNEDAVSLAKKTLLDEDVTKDWFAEYDEREEGEWEYGEDVYVHAVGPNGENFVVSVLKTECK